MRKRRERPARYWRPRRAPGGSRPDPPLCTAGTPRRYRAQWSPIRWICLSAPVMPMSGVDGEATHQGHQTASARVLVLVGEVPAALMIAPGGARRKRAERALGGHRRERRNHDDLDGRQVARVHRHRDGQARPGGDPAPGTGDIGADRRDRGPGAGALGLRRREDVDGRGERWADAPVTGEQPSMRDANGSKAVVCVTGPAGRALVGSWWRPAPGKPYAVAAPRGWQACGGVPRRQAAWHRRPRRRAAVVRLSLRDGTGMSGRHRSRPLPTGARHANPGRLTAAPQLPLSGSCRGQRQTDPRPSARHPTVRCPGTLERSARAGAQSNGDQLTLETRFEADR